MQAAYDKVTIFRSAPAGAVWMAPVGHARAHSSQAVHRLKSITGNPNDAGDAERIGFGDDSGLETLDENSQHLIRSCGSLAIVSGI